ncbi:TrbM-domain protein [Escherichia coli]|uniref:TrbM-domain protein n=1 Tax=Escherichia coli TaxID=562 RepID=A0A377BG92_ECOLX|nr:TrbM-domain protein [Escherichia coli]
MHLTLALRYFAYMEKQSGKVEGVSAEVLKGFFNILKKKKGSIRWSKTLMPVKHF